MHFRHTEYDPSPSSGVLSSTAYFWKNGESWNKGAMVNKTQLYIWNHLALWLHLRVAYFLHQNTVSLHAQMYLNPFSALGLKKKHINTVVSLFVRLAWIQWETGLILGKELTTVFLRKSKGLAQSLSFPYCKSIIMRASCSWTGTVSGDWSSVSCQWA